jgi:hypothetical protein
MLTTPDNFSVVMPEHPKITVVLAHRDDAWWCIVYGKENKPIWTITKGSDTAELALRKMLVSSGDLVFAKFHTNA